MRPEPASLSRQPTMCHACASFSTATSTRCSLNRLNAHSLQSRLRLVPFLHRCIEISLHVHIVLMASIILCDHLKIPWQAFLEQILALFCVLCCSRGSCCFVRMGCQLQHHTVLNNGSRRLSKLHVLACWHVTRPTCGLGLNPNPRRAFIHSIEHLLQAGLNYTYALHVRVHVKAQMCLPTQCAPNSVVVAELSSCCGRWHT